MGWPLTGEWAPREALFVKLLWPLVLYNLPVSTVCTTFYGMIVGSTYNVLCLVAPPVFVIDVQRCFSFSILTAKRFHETYRTDGQRLCDHAIKFTGRGLLFLAHLLSSSLLRASSGTYINRSTCYGYLTMTTFDIFINQILIRIIIISSSSHISFISQQQIDIITAIKRRQWPFTVVSGAMITTRTTWRVKLKTKLYCVTKK